MSYSIIFSTKILTLAAVPFLLILVGVLCEFAMVPDMYIWLTPKEGALFFPMGHMYKFGTTFIKKIWTFVYHYIFMSRLLLNCEKHKQWIQLFLRASFSLLTFSNFYYIFCVLLLILFPYLLGA